MLEKYSRLLVTTRKEVRVQTATIDLLALIGQDVTLRRVAATEAASIRVRARSVVDATSPTLTGSVVGLTLRSPITGVDNAESGVTRFSMCQIGMAWVSELRLIGWVWLTTTRIATHRQSALCPGMTLLRRHANTWQARAVKFCRECEERLWTPEGLRKPGCATCVG